MGQHRLTQRRAAIAATLATFVWAWTSEGHAFSSLFERVRQDATLSAGLPEGDAHAQVEEGILIGTGSERLSREADGTLRIVRGRNYTKLRHPETGKVVDLPEPWTATAVVWVKPSLRLISADTRYDFKRSAD